MCLVKAFDRNRFPVDFDEIARWYICPVEKYCFLSAYTTPGTLIKVPTWLNKLAFLIFYMRAQSPHYVRVPSDNRGDFTSLHGIVIDFDPKDKRPFWTFSRNTEGFFINAEGVSYLLPPPVQQLFKEIALFGCAVREQILPDECRERTVNVG